MVDLVSSPEKNNEFKAGYDFWFPAGLAQFLRVAIITCVKLAVCQPVEAKGNSHWGGRVLGWLVSPDTLGDCEGVKDRFPLISEAP